ncbi:hypothetical protein [Hymenobacter lucidus]|uniref:Uncharacterized protein n=1 Tax=Hymenobacter lucidus TaxID=2880930 RepID=A0ABS8AN06_9BACT|nr:hypothetical protein [Hymenobacter lucidus]MCB2407570.1 hypothetical protein [Hymenobacter lucidus]
MCGSTGSGRQRIVAVLHVVDDLAEQRYLSCHLAGANLTRKLGWAPGVDRVVLQPGLLVVGRQQLVLVADAVLVREVGAIQPGFGAGFGRQALDPGFE